MSVIGRVSSFLEAFSLLAERFVSVLEAFEVVDRTVARLTVPVMQLGSIRDTFTGLRD